jgi:hypothetical protein
MTDIAASLAGPPAGTWFKSSYSGGEGNECLEVADLHDRVAVRDSKRPRGGTLTFSADAFATFVEGVVRGEDPVKARTP